MTLLEALAVFVAGIGAGTINTIVGSGTLITFPTLLAVGFPPVSANVSNTVGLVPGSVSGALGYRRELDRAARAADPAGHGLGARRHHRRPAAAQAAGVGVRGHRAGADRARLRPRRPAAVDLPACQATGAAHRRTDPSSVWVLVYLCGIYGGYFGAAQGVLLIAIMGIGHRRDAAADQRRQERAGRAGQRRRRRRLHRCLRGGLGAAGLIAAGSVIGGAVRARRSVPPASAIVAFARVFVVAVCRRRR